MYLKIISHLCAKVWNASKCSKSFRNGCSVGMSRIPHQGLAALNLELCFSQEGQQSSGHPRVILTAFSYDEIPIQQTEEGPERTYGGHLLSWWRMEPRPRVLSDLPGTSGLVNLGRSSSNQLKILDLALWCSMENKIEAYEWTLMDDLNNVKCDPLGTHHRWDRFVCDLYHVSIKHFWPHFTDEKAEVCGQLAASLNCYRVEASFVVAFLEDFSRDTQLEKAWGVCLVRWRHTLTWNPCLQ